jgi:hypothetical protein
LPKRPNLSFIADEILPVLKRLPAQNGVFLHARTGTYVPKPALRDFYVAARAEGYRTIVAYEPFGISRATNKPYEFNFDDQPSAGYFNGMIIHNYPRLPVDAGYSVRSASVIETNFPIHPDHRVIELLATCKA